ncbi:hypothetical protein [Mariniflexile sp.]|uniref:hypothetical protein n=1 Tax=Mariniflexile sp. TaxID=1979402 RepID=UPI003567CA6A
MKISLIIISTILVLSVVVPFLLFVYNGTKNTSNIKKQANELTKSNGITYAIKEIWRKNFIGISSDNALLTYIKFSDAEPGVITEINLKDIKQCNIIKNHNNANKNIALKSLALEFVYKSNIKPTLTIPFFEIDEDLSEDFELQRVEKWHTLIKNALTVQPNLKLAS